MIGNCYYCKKAIKRGGIRKEGKLFHKVCYVKYSARPRRIAKAHVFKVRATLNGHRLVHGYRITPRKRR